MKRMSQDRSPGTLPIKYKCINARTSVPKAIARARASLTWRNRALNVRTRFKFMVTLTMYSFGIVVIFGAFA